MYIYISRLSMHVIILLKMRLHLECFIKMWMNLKKSQSLKLEHTRHRVHATFSLYGRFGYHPSREPQQTSTSSSFRVDRKVIPSLGAVIEKKGIYIYDGEITTKNASEFTIQQSESESKSICHPLDDILYLRNMKIMNGWIFYPIGSMGRLYIYLHDLADFYYAWLFM